MLWYLLRMMHHPIRWLVGLSPTICLQPSNKTRRQPWCNSCSFNLLFGGLALQGATNWLASFLFISSHHCATSLPQRCLLKATCSYHVPTLVFSVVHSAIVTLLSGQEPPWALSMHVSCALMYLACLFGWDLEGAKCIVVATWTACFRRTRVTSIMFSQAKSSSRAW